MHALERMPRFFLPQKDSMPQKRLGGKLLSGLPVEFRVVINLYCLYYDLYVIVAQQAVK